MHGEEDEDAERGFCNEHRVSGSVREDIFSNERCYPMTEDSQTTSM